VSDSDSFVLGVASRVVREFGFVRGSMNAMIGISLEIH
jgi:hypothetical protein